MALQPAEIRDYLEAIGIARATIDNLDGVALSTLYVSFKGFLNVPTERCPRCKENCFSVNDKGFCANCRFDLAREKLEREAIGGVKA
jgi:hypothetical protein